jgi:hypothetical protein
MGSLLVAAFGVCFCLSAGTGWAYLGPSLLATVLIFLSLCASGEHEKAGAISSGLGSLLCAVILIATILVVAPQIGLHNPIVLIYFLSIPAVMLTIVGWHIVTVLAVVKGTRK